jgi:uncharacterized membrane protein (UPF0127 family)
VKLKLCAALILVSLVGISCGYGDDDGASATPGPTLETATAIIETDDGPVMVNVEVAATDEERARGLMNRESLDEDSGMLFLFFEPASGGFWMKNTLIPLSIAFFNRDGEILRILDMAPCKKEPCKVYDPGVTYSGALEVNQGALEEWGVEEGDIIESNV